MRRALALAAILVLLAGCAEGADGSLGAPDLSSRVQVDTPALRTAKQQAKVAPCPDRTEGVTASELPELTLPCLGGGPAVTLSGLRGPAVVSLWASWCTSCPDELPLYQRLFEEAPAELQVVGVDYQDTQPGKAIELLRLTGARFPQVADPGGNLADHYRVAGLPGIVLVDADGRVTFRLRRIESYAELRDMVERHTGVSLGAG